MKRKLKLFTWIAGALLLLLVICDFIIKILASAKSISTLDYLKRYYEMNLYGLDNIYVLTFLNVFFGIVVLLIFLKSKKDFGRKTLLQTMIIINSILLFLNLFSLM